MFNHLLSLLFPPSPSEKVLESCSYLKADPRRRTTPRGVAIQTCARYDDPPVTAAIKVLKKHGSPRAAELLAQLLTDVILEEIADARIWNTQEIILIPLPMTAKRKRTRGFNHLAKILVCLPKELQSCVVSDALIQIKDVPMQKTLGRAKRLTNVIGIFTVPDTTKVHNKQVILIDDVLTTGATMDEAIHTLKNSGAHVTAITLARA